VTDDVRALATVGVPHPGGRPETLRDHASAWDDLAVELDRHGDRLAALLVDARSALEGHTVDAFSRQAVALEQAMRDAAHTARTVAQAQHQHAREHSVALAILRELGIQIGVTLAFMAAAAAFPALLAAAQAQLALLALHASRTIAFLARALAGLVRFLVTVRTWLQQAASLALRTRRLSIPAGRMIVEGARDVLVDVAANVISLRAQGKPINTRELFVNGAITGGVSALLPGVERLGLRRSGSGSSAEYVTLGQKYQNLLKRSSGPPQTRVRGSNAGSTSMPARQELLDRLTLTRAEARKEGIRGLRDEGARLGGEVRAARDGFSEARATHRHAERMRREADDALRREAMAVHDQRAADALRASTAESAARQELARVSDALDAAERQMTTWRDLADASRAVRAEVSTVDQLRHAWQRNVWRENLGQPKEWREALLYDGLKDGLKGTANNAAQAGVGVAEGRADGRDVWLDAVLGGSFGAGRGALKGATINVWYPRESIEDISWRIGTKALDEYLRSQAKNAIVNDLSDTGP
jgi:hypothetical protein